MSERLADISARFEGIEQLGSVVNAMKGIAAARARKARGELAAVDSYAASISAALAQVLGDEIEKTVMPSGKTGLLVFAAEQGFAGAFSERVLQASLRARHTALYMIGTRGVALAAARGLSPEWSGALPSHTQGIPKLADSISKVIYHAVAQGRIDRLDVIVTHWDAGHVRTEQETLFPIDLASLPVCDGPLPLMQVPRAALIEALSQDHFHAQLCKAALHAFAAENEARMMAMSSAASQIERELARFQASLRRVRQEAITAEIIELGTGVAKSAAKPRRAS
jgi:F-type H+-transporting ATPase subunit gamma